MNRFIAAKDEKMKIKELLTSSILYKYLKNKKLIMKTNNPNIIPSDKKRIADSVIYLVVFLLSFEAILPERNLTTVPCNPKSKRDNPPVKEKNKNKV